MKIDSSYFTEGRRLIMNAPNAVSAYNKNNHAVGSAIEAYIDQYSLVFLTKVLGSVKKAKEMLDSDGSNEYLGSLFMGLKEPWADFIMYQILRYSGQKSTIDGVVELKCGNTVISPAIYQANVWNDMVDRLRVFSNDFPEIRVDQSLLTKITSCWV